MGKSGMDKSLGKSRKQRITEAIEKLRSAGKMEDEDVIIVPLNIQKTKWEITPKKMSAKDYHLYLTRRFIERGQQDMMICYLNKEGDKVIMEAKTI